MHLHGPLHDQEDHPLDEIPVKCMHGFMDTEMKTHKSTCVASLRLASWHFKLANGWPVG